MNLPHRTHSQSTAITGASGFIGRAVANSVIRPGGDARQLVRTPGVGQQAEGATIIGDVRDKSAMDMLCQGASALIHAASYTGRDPEQCREINVNGTKSAVTAAQRAGVTRIIYVSTCAVYGTGPHRGESVRDLAPAPESAASRSRLEAEEIVLGAGGTVVRPNLIFGPGDKWFLPGLIKLTNIAGGMVEGSAAQVSVISAMDLGHLLAGLAMTAEQPSAVLHAANPLPVRVADILDCLTGRLPADTSPYCTFEDAMGPLTQAGFSRHQVAMVAFDHWYEAQQIWTEAGVTVPAPEAVRTALSDPRIW